jgi:hypothetical protein
MDKHNLKYYNNEQEIVIKAPKGNASKHRKSNKAH